MKNGYWIILVSCILAHASQIFPSERKIFRRHYLILYDNSYPFYSEEEKNLRMRNTLISLFNNKVPAHVRGEYYNLKIEQKNQIKFFDPEKDEISFYFFGLNYNNARYLKSNRSRFKRSKKLYPLFKECFINAQRQNWSEFRADGSGSVEEYLKTLWRIKKPKWGNGYTLSNLVYPVALENIKGSDYANEYTLIIASDFLTGADFGNKQDYSVIKGIFDSRYTYSDEILNNIEYLKSKFYRIHYFDFEFSTGKLRDGMPVLLGLMGVKVRANAGFLEPENTTIKFDSDVRLGQSGYQSANFEISDVLINFLHNKDLRVASIMASLRETGSGRLLAQEAIAAYHANSRQLLCNNGKIVEIDTSRMNYKIPGVDLKVDSLAFKKKWDSSSLEISYTFNTDYKIRFNESIKMAFTATRSITAENIDYASKTSVIIMQIVIPVILFIAAMITLIFLGKPKRILVKIDGFADTLEKVDYMKYGRVKTPYGPWLIKVSTLRVRGQIGYLWPMYPFNWKPPIYVMLQHVEALPGFDIYLKATDETGTIYSEGHDMRISRGEYNWAGSFETFVEIKQISDDQINEPKPMNFKLGVAIDSKFLFHAKIVRSLNYDFHIGPSLSKVWVGLDPGTTGSCIASASHGADIVIEMNGGREFIMPSVISFDKEDAWDTSHQTNGQIDKRFYNYGEAAASALTSKSFTTYQSIKKMLGYNDAQQVYFNNGNKLSLDGKKLTQLLLAGIITRHKAYIEAHKTKFKSLLDNGKYSPERVVLAIPNNFTSTKVQALMESARTLNRFKETRYLYEAEAVFLYYLFNHDEFTSSTEGLVKETVLIFDMGGATINATIIDAYSDIEDETLKYDATIVAKLGYGIGGDTIDYCLIKFLYEFSKEYPDLAKNHPFKSTIGMNNKDREAQLRDRKMMMDVAFELKKKIIENFNDPDIKFILKTTDIEDALKARGIYISIHEDHKIATYLERDGLFEHELFQKLIYKNVSSATRDILSFRGDFEIDTVIFSGRTTLFPLIRETVMNEIRQVLGQQVQQIELSEDELKSAVAKGACLYGVNRNSIVLNNLMTSSNFGILRTRGASDLEFLNLIPVGRRFHGEDDTIEGVTECEDNFAFDNHFVNFYQVMGKNPEQILKNREKHKYSLLERLEVHVRTSRIGMKVSQNDEVTCAVEEVGGISRNETALVADQEIADANDEHYTWIIH